MTTLEHVLGGKMVILTNGESRRTYVVSNGMRLQAIRSISLYHDISDHGIMHCALQVVPGGFGWSKIDVQNLDDARLVVAMGYDDHGIVNHGESILWDWLPIPLVRSYDLYIHADGDVTCELMLLKQAKGKHPITLLKPGALKWLKILYYDTDTGVIEYPSDTL